MPETAPRDMPIGTAVRFWSGVREGAGVETKTRSVPWALSDGTWVVLLEGQVGGFALTHVEPLQA